MRPSSLKALPLVASLFAGLAFATAFATAQTPDPTLDPDSEPLLHSAINPALTLTEIRQALWAIPAQQGRFFQRNPNGSLSQGQFHLSLPDKMRFAYDGEPGSIITIAGRWISVQEEPGGEANRFPVSLTPLKLLRETWAEPIDPANVKAFTIGERTAELSLVDGEGDTPGEIRIIFDYPSMRLLGWQTTDVQNLETQIVLRQVEYVESLPNSTFFVDENERDD